MRFRNWLALFVAIALPASAFAVGSTGQNINPFPPYVNIVAPNTLGPISQAGSITFTATGSAVIFKQGSNGQVGTVVASGTTEVIASNTSIATGTAVVLSLRVASGTVSAQPFLSSLTPGVGFGIKAGAADVSTYNYTILQNAP